jgi:hypothetical protein
MEAPANLVGRHPEAEQLARVEERRLLGHGQRLAGKQALE